VRGRPISLLVVLCLGHVLLISSQVPMRDGSTALHGAAFGSVARVEAAVAALADGVTGLWSHYVALGGASRENEALRQRVLELEGQLLGEQARAGRVDGLEDALNLQRSLVAPTRAARVIAGNPVPGVLTVTVDQGSDAGVQANMAVINGRGVVGRVIVVAAHAATIQLLADRAASAGAILEKSGTAGNVSGGFADGQFRLGLVSSAATMAVGERVVTSGQDGIFPQGFLLGQVSQINGTGKAREIVVAPAVDFARLNVVLIVLAKPAQTGGPTK